MSDDPSESAAQRENIAQALSKVASQGQNYMSNELGAREKLIESARELIAATESPMESLLWAIWAQVQAFDPRMLFFPLIKTSANPHARRPYRCRSQTI